MNSIIQLLPEVSLLLTAICILFIDIAFSDKIKRFIPFFAILGVATGLVFSVSQWGTDVQVFHVLKHDSVTILSSVLISITMIGLILISSGYIKNLTDQTPFYYALLVLNGLAALLLAGTTNILMLVLSFEFLSITAYVLTGYLHYNTRSTEAAIKYLIYGAVILALMLYGISWLYGLTGQTDYVLVAEGLTQPGHWFTNNVVSPSLLLPTIIFISAGFAFKIAAAPFHQWAPDAYEGAPIPVTALLATIPKIAGFVVLFRVSTTLFPIETGVGQLWNTPLLGLLSAAAMLLGSLGGLMQTDVKRMMAYSGITQAGYALMGLAVGSSKGVVAQFVYLIAYVIAELGIFAAISNVTVRKELTDLAEFRGLYHRSPNLSLVMMISLMSLTGLPGTVGFIGKLTLFTACLETDNLWLAVIGVINTVISFAYYWQLIRVMWLETAEMLPSVNVRISTIPVLLISTVSIVGLGLFPSILLRVVEMALRHL